MRTDVAASTPSIPPPGAGEASGAHASTQQIRQQPAASAPSGETRLECRDLRCSFGGVTALDDVSLSLSPGEIVAVLGQSGCGKTTLLRAIAGLQPLSGGEILLDGRRLAGGGLHVPPDRRGIGMMFQDIALFPHMSVLANVCFGLRGSARSVGDVALARLREVGLEHRAGSYPAALSGGEAQRVALARALAPQPRVLLLDEPFSSLDAGTRDDVQAEMLGVLRRAQITALIVTHNRDEAINTSDRVAFMHEGRIVQVGTAEHLYDRPASRLVARALGDLLEVPGRARDGFVHCALGAFPLPDPAMQGPVCVAIRPQSIGIGAPGTGTPARVVGRVFAGQEDMIELGVEGLVHPIRLRVGRAWSGGEAVSLILDPFGAFVFRQQDATAA